MLGYIRKQLQKYKHASPPRPQHCPYSPEPKQYGNDAPRPLPEDTSPPPFQKRHQARPAGDREYPILCPRCRPHDPHGFEHYCKQASKRDGEYNDKTKQLLDYLATHPDATVRFHPSDMILNIHSDASYLLAVNAHSRACRHFFHGMESQPH